MGLRKQDDTRELVRTLLGSQMFAVLSTRSDAEPHLSLVAFWAPADLGHVVFATARSTRKYGLLTADPRVALLFDDRSNSEMDVFRATAITAVGIAREAADEAERLHLSLSLLARHPRLESFVAQPECVLVRVDVDVYRVVNDFQSVVELPREAFVGLPASGQA